MRIQMYSPRHATPLRGGFYDSIALGLSSDQFELDWQVLAGCGPHGISRNRADGLDACTSDFVVSLDSDCTIETEGWLDLMMETMLSSPDIGVVGARIVFEDGSVDSAGTGTDLRPRFHGEMDISEELDRSVKWQTHQPSVFQHVHEDTGVAGNLMLIRRGVLERAHFWHKESYYDYHEKLVRYINFDRKFIGRGGYEDTDFCIRMRKNGYKTMYDGRVKVIHHRKPPSSLWRALHWNHLLFHLKHPHTILKQWGY